MKTSRIIFYADSIHVFPSFLRACVLTKGHEILVRPQAPAKGRNSFSEDAFEMLPLRWANVSGTLPDTTHGKPLEIAMSTL
jgi:hypothetical protein